MPLLLLHQKHSPKHPTAALQRECLETEPLTRAASVIHSVYSATQDH